MRSQRTRVKREAVAWPEGRARMRDPAPRTTARRRPAALTLACLAAGAGAQGLAFPGCPALQPSDFKRVQIHSLSFDRVTKFAFVPDGRILFAAQSGKVGILDPETGAFSEAGKIPDLDRGIWGLMGLAPDPEFTANGRIFFYATRQAAADSAVSPIRRYILKDGRLDLATERIILEWPVQRQGVDHSGGGMGIDPRGNVYVSTGDNTNWTQNRASVNEVDEKFNALRSAGNTNDLRGKIIRIRPRPLPETDPAPAPGPGSTYDIPEGNLFPPGTAGARPEIYVMGNRNPFTLTVDAATGWPFWADVGTQAPQYPAEKGPAGVQADIDNGRSAGSLYEVLVRDVRYAGAYLAQPPASQVAGLYESADWNLVELKVRGAHVEVSLNGMRVVYHDLAQAEPQGFFAFQLHDKAITKISLKDIEITEAAAPLFRAFGNPGLSGNRDRPASLSFRDLAGRMLSDGMGDGTRFPGTSVYAVPVYAGPR